MKPFWLPKVTVFEQLQKIVTLNCLESAVEILKFFQGKISATPLRVKLIGWCFVFEFFDRSLILLTGTFWLYTPPLLFSWDPEIPFFSHFVSNPHPNVGKDFLSLPCLVFMFQLCEHTVFVCMLIILYLSLCSSWFVYFCLPTVFYLDNWVLMCFMFSFLFTFW